MHAETGNRPLTLIRNRSAEYRLPLDSADVQAFDAVAAREVQRFLALRADYAPTPLVALPILAEALGIHAIHIKDEGKRLKCYDRLDRSSSGAQERSAQRRGGGDTGWIVNDEKSPLDDSPLVSAALASSDDRSHLLLRCKDRKTEVAVSITGIAGPDG